MFRRHHTLQTALNRLYIARKIARIKEDKRLETLLEGAIRELEDLKGEVLDLETWLASHRGIYDIYTDQEFTAFDDETGKHDSDSQD